MRFFARAQFITAVDYADVFEDSLKLTDWAQSRDEQSEMLNTFFNSLFT